MKRIAFLILIFLFLNQKCYATPNVFSDEEAVKVILGATADEGDKEMFAVACALHNREFISPTIIGDHKYYAVEERMADISNVSKNLKDRAMEFWIKSFHSPDITKGSNRWINEPVNGNVIRPKNINPKWATKKNLKIQIGRHKFYKVEE